MNKLTVVIGVAAVATLAGCKDPDYKGKANSAETQVKQVEAEPAATQPVTVEEKHCTCAPGTKHYKPCQCGAPDCMCIVEVKPIAPAAPEFTEYTVQAGDYLAKISKKFNVTINGIKKINPSIKKDIVRIGQKLKIPGKHDIAKVAAAPVVAARPANGGKKAAAAYKGATKEYVVKNGDTLGAIAYGNGITIRQLKELNGLSNNNLKIGQKLKIPAEKVQKAAVKEEAKKPAVEAPVVEPVKSEAAPAVEPEVKPAADNVAPAVQPAEVPSAAPAAEPEAATTTYTVQEGDDLTGVSIRWGVSVAAICELNNITPDAQLKPGQTIKLPAEAQQ